MEKVPKIVTERLQATMVAASHPDADLLTAFSEHSLPERERGRVVEHLARCSECREVVALALPAEEPAVMEFRPAQGGWLTWPRMRWCLAAAGVVAIVSFGLVRYQRQSRPQTMALYNGALPAAGPTEAKNQPVPAPAVPEAKTEAKKEDAVASVPPSVALPANARRDGDKEYDRLEQFADLRKAPEKSAVGFGSGGGYGVRLQQLPHGPKAPAQFQQNMTLNANSNNAFIAPAPPPPPPAVDQRASNQAVVGGPLPTPSTRNELAVNEKQDVSKLAVVGQSSAPLQTPGGSAGAEIARAKPATPASAPQAQASDAYAISADSSNFSPSGSLAPESARWAINSAGGLQRSMDQGQTWQDVDVVSTPEVFGALKMQKAMRNSRARVAGKDNTDAKTKAIVFRAVSANGPDVWAGGSEANLYHSTDSGAHWMRVLPSWRGIDLTGDIINVQFADPQRGRIITSAAEIWTTADAGQTWEKR